MKLLLPLLLAPVLSLAAATGSVTLLDGTPVSGAVIKSLTDSVTTSATGFFALGRTSGIASRSAKTIHVTSHLVVENGRPRLTFAGMDIAGRARPTATARQNLSSHGASFAARSTGTPDTLKVYWKGKRLTVLPVTSDTTITFRIDTAWKDDAGIPWNPAITYGSLFDSRDGQTYRTVTIGTQTWMAENLNHAGNATVIGRCYGDLNTNCVSMGRLYSWAETMDLDTSFNSSFWLGTAKKGICPSGWHVPDRVEWKVFVPEDSSKDTSWNTIKKHIGWNYDAGILCKSSKGWGKPGTDSFGFRALNSGATLELNGNSYLLSNTAYFASSSENPTVPGPDASAWTAFLRDQSDTLTFFDAVSKHAKVSLRCLKD